MKIYFALACLVTLCFNTVTLGVEKSETSYYDDHDITHTAKALLDQSVVVVAVTYDVANRECVRRRIDCGGAIRPYYEMLGKLALTHFVVNQTLRGDIGDCIFMDPIEGRKFFASGNNINYIFPLADKSQWIMFLKSPFSNGVLDKSYNSLTERIYQEGLEKCFTDNQIFVKWSVEPYSFHHICIHWPYDNQIKDERWRPDFRFQRDSHLRATPLVYEDILNDLRSIIRYIKEVEDAGTEIQEVTLETKFGMEVYIRVLDMLRVAPVSPKEDAGKSTGSSSETKKQQEQPGDVFDFSQAERPPHEAQAAQRFWAEHHNVPLEMKNAIGMTLRLIPPGTYMRGGEQSPEETMRRYGNFPKSVLQREHPRHKVSLTYSFYMAATPVTQEQYQAVMGNNPSHFKGDPNRPVEMVSWNDAVAFCERLTQQEREAGRIGPDAAYRLPTEAEWEYACRAGTITTYYTGDNRGDLDEAGWYSKNSNSSTQPVGLKRPNAFGLYDMHGNVFEWCSDWFDEYSSASVTDPRGPVSSDQQVNIRVLRGGTWSMGATGCRAAIRIGTSPDHQRNGDGFRVVLSLPELELP